MKKIPFLIIIISILYINGCSLLDKIEPDHNKDDFILNSPKKKYYTQTPVLNYTANFSDHVEIYLNDNKIEIFNNYEIKESITGYNKLTVKSVKSNIETIRTVEYFYNKISLNKSDDFNREDNSVGNIWSNSYLSKEDNSRFSFYSNNEIPKFSESYSQYLNLNSDSAFIQEIEISYIDSPVFIDRYFLTGPNVILGGIKHNKSGNYNLVFFKRETNNFQSTHVLQLITDDFSLQSIEGHNLILYKNNSLYNLLLVDKEKNIINSININDDSDINGQIMLMRLEPNTHIQNEKLLFQIDNFCFFM